MEDVAVGYYDYWPTRLLKRRLCVAGEDDTSIRRAAFAVASLNGWRISLIDDLLQHRCGLSAREYRAEYGRREADELCERTFERLPQNGPPGVVAFPAGWVPKRLLKWNWRQERATLIILESRTGSTRYPLDERVFARAHAVVGLSVSSNDARISEQILSTLEF